MDLILDVNIQIYPVDLGTPPGWGAGGWGGGRREARPAACGQCVVLGCPFVAGVRGAGAVLGLSCVQARCCVGFV